MTRLSGRQLTSAKGLREFESLTVNRTHGLADDVALRSKIRVSAISRATPALSQ